MLEDLVNLKVYTPLELVFFGVGCYMWAMAYIIFIVHIFRHKHVTMPIAAVAANFGWEFVWAWINPMTDMGALLVFCYRAWFFLDIIIIYAVIRYGAWQFTVAALKKNHAGVTILTTLFFFAFFTTMKTGGYDTPIGANSAYIAQMLISSLYIILILKSGRSEPFSKWIAWLRTVGTGLNDIFMFMHYPDNHFLHVMCVASLLMDAFFIYLVYNKDLLVRIAGIDPDCDIRDAPKFI